MSQIDGLGIEDLLADRREQILAIADRHGAYNVRVFGSVARGEARIDSDVDFLIDYQLDKITCSISNHYYSEKLMWLLLTCSRRE
jgi:uncharacterized protein